MIDPTWAQQFAAGWITLSVLRPGWAKGRPVLTTEYGGDWSAGPEPRLRACCRRDDGGWLGDLRRFYRLSDAGKLRHVDSACAAT